MPFIRATIYLQKAGLVYDLMAEKSDLKMCQSTLPRHAGQRRRAGDTACQQRGDQHGPTEAPHLRSSAFALLIENLHRAPPFG